MGHIFVRYEETNGTSWAPDLETNGGPLEAFVRAFKVGSPRTLTRLRSPHPTRAPSQARREDLGGPVKVTAFEPFHTRGSRLGDHRCDAILFPSGTHLSDVDRGDPAALVDSFLSTQAQQQDGTVRLPGLQLFVCTHASRDRRCSDIGEPLLARLDTVARQTGLYASGALGGLYRCSHVGGHVYAGNLLAFRSGGLQEVGCSAAEWALRPHDQLVPISAAHCSGLVG